MTEMKTGDYLVTTDKARLDLADIHAWLSTEAYWCKGIPMEVVRTAFENSFVCGIVFQEKTVGYARLITDYATFAYLADVFVMQQHRGKGLSKAMMDVLMNQPWVSGLRRMMLATLDAHGLYTQYGFTALPHPERIMVKALRDAY